MAETLYLDVHSAKPNGGAATLAPANGCARSGSMSCHPAQLRGQPQTTMARCSMQLAPCADTGIDGVTISGLALNYWDLREGAIELTIVMSLTTRQPPCDGASVGLALYQPTSPRTPDEIDLSVHDRPFNFVVPFRASHDAASGRHEAFAYLQTNFCCLPAALVLTGLPSLDASMLGGNNKLLLALSRAHEPQAA